METKGDYIRRKCLERLNTNPNLGVLEFQDGIFVGMEYNEANKYSEEDMLTASRYGYNYHKSTQFPEQEFEDGCIRNTQQWLTTFKK